MDEPHPAIDKKALLAEMDRLIAQPDNKAWQYLLNVINLGLLEKLHEQDERSMGYEQDLQAVMDTISILDAPGTARLRLQFDIEPEADLLNRPLRFAEDCSLVTEHRSGKIYLNKKEVLAYEIEENERLWRDFLFAIDDERSTAQLLRDVQGEFDNIRDYFYLCLKEGILIV